MIKDTLKIRALVGGLIYSLAICFPAYADDTEVFFGAPPSAANVHPNVLFILDTSGSMGTQVGSTGLNRMEHMKLALHSILDSVNNINVGLMRFNDPGGPILFPTTFVDEPIETVSPGDPAGTVTSRISDGNDDVEEIGALMTMQLASTHLEMAHGAASTGQTTITRKVDNRYDDMEQYSSGSMSLWGSQWDMNSNQTNGLRFKNITIPPGSTINSARIKLTARRSDTSDAGFRFYGEDIGDAPTFATSSYNVSSRTKTSASILWEPAAWIQYGEYNTPDLSSIVQEIVDRGDWASGNDMAFIETYVSGNRRRPYRYGGSASRAAELTVTYTPSPADTQKVGLRFTNVAIPQGATILSATIEFTAAQSTSNAVNLTIKGIDDDNAAAFGAAAGDLTMRPKTGNSVAWSPGAWTSDDVYQTDDLTAVVQEIVNRSGWCGNNAMAFEISGPDVDNRVAYSYEGSPNKAPLLRVTYDPDTVPAGGGCINEWLYYRVGQSTDDAEEYNSNGGMSLTGTVFNIQSSQTNGLRFNDVRINQGATIMEARLQLTSKYNDTGSMTITLKAENNDDANTYSSVNSDISNRPTTGAVSWSPTDWVANGTYESPDIKSLVQSVVNRTGWTPGNAMALVVEASGSKDRRAFTYNSSAGAAALLKIKVQFGGVFAGSTYTVRSKLHDLVDDLVPSGWTPIVDTLYESALYYRGEGVLYGKGRGQQTKYGRLSHPSSYTGGTVVQNPGCSYTNPNATACYNEYIDGNPIYTSPIVDQCQSSYTVLLTDGQANHNNSTGLIKSLTGTSCNSSSGGESCARELVKWMAEADQAASIDGLQNVRTYTIGFNLDEGGQASAIQFLKDLAELGKGEYYSASTSSELAGVFQNIIREILSVDTTFVAPGVTVNQFNRLAHSDELYFSLFKPSDSTRWPGNLKRYGLYGSATEATKIVDVNNDPAVDAATGFFKTTAQSWWSPNIDGGAVEEGGAASKMPTSLSRNVFTYTGTNSSLADSTNRLHEANTAITKAMLGLEGETDSYVQNVLKWARGIDVTDYDNDGDTTEDRMQMGDPLHSRPVVVTYGTSGDVADATVYVATNEGFLHAVDTATGQEQFAFMPQELLVNLNALYKNSSASVHTYGLDGQISYWLDDKNGDFVVDPAAGDRVYLYFGMRRGGNYYYALDVTDRTNPKWLWKIEGGVGDFAELSQTWSKPSVAQIDVAGVKKRVLIFGGGYDTDNDINTVRTADSEGRAIFIVDAETGALVWSGGPDVSFTKRFDDMLYSIPSDITLVDINLDGLTDQMYVGDMGAQVWRFDIHNGNVANALVTGSVIADLGGSTAVDNRKFYYPPDVALLSKPGYNSLSIILGSGWRAHPLDTVVNDRFYTMRLSDIYAPPADSNEDGEPDYPKYTEADLYDATANIIGEGADSEKLAANSALEGLHGWYIHMEDSGEKVLSTATTLDGTIYFTSYAPHAATSACGAAQGGGYLYAVSLWDATPTLNLDGTGSETDLVKDDRRRQLGRMGIPPSPQVMMPEDGGTIVLIGTEKFSINVDIRRRTYWYEEFD
ncbi:MAG TPA: VWA domain-containing protein [Sedimenticola sp.]|nr:VWA domain-containing protein [Sedimenticola sp.]